MAKPWADVAASPAYQAMSPDQQAAAKDQYFNQVIVPQLQPDEVDAARSQFEEQVGESHTPPTSALRRAAEFVGGNILQGAESMAESIGKGMPGLEAPLKSVQDIRAKQGKPPEEALKTPSALELAGKLDPKLIEQMQPETPSGKYAAAALQALPAALGGEGGLVGRAVGAMAAGVGARAGGEIAGPTGALVGGLLGGGLLGGAKTAARAPTAGEALSTKTGIPLTIGEATGNKTLKQVETLAGSAVGGSGMAYKDKLAQTQAGVAAVSNLANKMTTNVANAEQLGGKLQTALKTAVTNIDALRSQTAAADYAAVRALAQNRPVITYNKTVAELDKIIDETKDIPSGDSKKIFQQATDMRNQLSMNGQARAFAIDPAMRTRSTWGAAARGTGNVFTDVEPNQQRRFAARLFGAIDNDFADASNANTPIAQALAKANKNYASYSKSIDQVRKSSLASLVGEDTVDAAFSGHVASTKAPEKMAQSFMNLQPSQARTVTGILQKHAPQVLQDTKAYVLRDLLQKSSGDVTRGELPMSFPKFLQNYNKIEPKLREMGFTNQELSDIKDVTKVMSMASDRIGQNPSGTAQGVQFAAAGLTHGLTLIPPYVASKALLTPGGRALLRQSVAASRAVRYRATRSLMATYGTERDR